MKSKAILILSLFLSLGAEAKPIDPCKLYGRIQVVEHFEDVKVKVVLHFEDVRVKKVSSRARRPGEWQMVEHFPDFKIKFVSHFPDFKIKYVLHFPGCVKRLANWIRGLIIAGQD